MRAFVSTILICCALAMAGNAWAQGLQANEMLSDPVLESRAQGIGKQLRCLVCRNQSILDSNAGLARDLRNVVRERIEAGDNDGQVLDYVVARYGDFVLLKPPVKPVTYTLWIAPFLFLLIALLTGAYYYRKQRLAASDELELSDADQLQAQRILRGEEQ